MSYTPSRATNAKLCPLGLLENGRQLLLVLAREGQLDADRRDAQRIADAIYDLLYDQ